MHRAALWIPIALLMLAPTGHADESKPKKPDVRVWEGYLRTHDGRLEMGYPVVAKGVSGGAGHVVAPEKGTTLDRLVEKLPDSFVFWNYTLERPHAEVKDELPHVLVRVRPLDAGDGMMFDAPLVMEPAKLLSVEFVDPAWLEHWALVFREKHSPWRIRDEPRPADRRSRMKVLAPKIQAALEKMRAVPGPTDAQRKAVAKIDAGADVVTRFRQRTELGIARWLRAVNEELDLGLEGLDALPTPPRGTALQAWFLEAESKTAFLERVKKAWDGDLGLLRLPNYVESGNSTTWVETDVDDVAAWDDATWLERRRITASIVAR